MEDTTDAEDGMIGTSGGIPVTDKLIEELADEAERGYTDDHRTRARRPSSGHSGTVTF